MEPEVDDSVCPVCDGSTYVGETISCEVCCRWFHFSCVGVDHGDACVQSEDVPYYCPSCDVSIRRAKKAKKQAQAKELKAKALASSSSSAALVAVSSPSSVEQEEVVTVAPLGDTLDQVMEVDTTEPGPATDEAQLVMDTAKGRAKVGAKSAEGSVVTQMLPQLEVSQLKSQKNKSEEEAWLDAVESGDLEQVESCDSELRSLREPSFRTARQRALAGGDEDGLEMLQFGRKTVEKEVTEEERVSKAQKRREIETEKREKMKQKTMDMLLKKKDSKATKQIKTAKSSTKEDSPIISYINNGAGISLSYPPCATYPLTKTVAAPPRPALSCSMCSSDKKYRSSKTGSPLCSSLACYKADLARGQSVVES